MLFDSGGRTQKFTIRETSGVNITARAPIFQHFQHQGAQYVRRSASTNAHTLLLALLTVSDEAVLFSACDYRNVTYVTLTSR
jgi:hypothetical protein